MEIWGVTGVIGSGKSSAIKYLYEKGYSVIDADQASRIVVDRNRPEGKEGFEKVLKTFGTTVLDNLGNLDRKALRKRMILNPHERDKLEEILHPLIIQHISQWMKKEKERGAKIAFVEGSRLIESGFHKILAGLILVVASEANRVKRVMKRDSMGKDEVQAMMELQNEEAMKAYCKYQWKNDKSLTELHKQIDGFLAERVAKRS